MRDANYKHETEGQVDTLVNCAGVSRLWPNPVKDHNDGTSYIKSSILSSMNLCKTRTEDPADAVAKMMTEVEEWVHVLHIP